MVTRRCLRAGLGVRRAGNLVEEVEEGLVPRNESIRLVAGDLRVVPHTISDEAAIFGTGGCRRGELDAAMPYYVAPDVQGARRLFSWRCARILEEKLSGPPFCVRDAAELHGLQAASHRGPAGVGESPGFECRRVGDTHVVRQGPKKDDGLVASRDVAQNIAGRVDWRFEYQW